MKQKAQMGVNRTGIQMSPLASKEMTEASDNELAAAPLSAAQALPLAEMRASNLEAAQPLGSVPLPTTVKGALHTGAALVTGNSPQILVDKLGERLAFERAGARIYDALIAKVRAAEHADGHGNGTSMPDLAELEHIRNEEAEHFTMVADAMRQLGADPTAQTPGADLSGVESCGLMQAVTDPRTTVAQSLHAVLIAEMADGNGWEMLIGLARQQNHRDMVRSFTAALQNERRHLQQVQTWFERATLGGSPAGQASLS